MSLFDLDSAHRPFDALDERRAAELQARAACGQLTDDDASSTASVKAGLVAALPLIVGSLAHRMSRVELAKVLRHLAKQVERDGVIVQHGRIMSLD